MFKGLKATPPTKRHLRHWERVCRFLDAQPYRSVRYPFPSDPPMTARLFKRMARYGLVQHREDCSWRLARRWMSILSHLWSDSPDEDGQQSLPALPDASTPFIAALNVDTLYVSLFDQTMPTALVEKCQQYKTLAQETDAPVETPWRVFDAPLSMWKAGVGTSGKGHGVSWSFLLRNAYVMVRLRRTPLQGLVGSVRLSAECLWTYGARAALDSMRETLATMWGEAGESGHDAFPRLRWQLSQLHLCTDLANFAPEPADLDRFVTRARKKAIYVPSVAEVSNAYSSESATADNLLDLVGELAMPEEWADLPPTFFAEDLTWGEFEHLTDESDPDNNIDDDEGATTLSFEETPANEAGASVYLWGKRASGFAFAPGSPLSAAIYDKVLEARQSGKRWMEHIHRAGGWTPDMSLFRVEGRFGREVLREIATGLNLERGEWCDDPWLALDHLGDFWGFFAGLPPEHDHAPDATYRGWLRLTIPQPNDENCTRWPTDPVWNIVQRAQFTPGAQPMPLHRVQAVIHNLDQIDAELYGLFKLRSVLCSRQHRPTLTLSIELRDFADRMEEMDVEKAREYYEEVREKARMLGQSVPPRSANLVTVTLAGPSVRKRKALPA